jgi:large subunit ribosomal protein L25
MEKNTLEAFHRNQTKKSAAKKLRREGKIPAVMYGHTTNKSLAVLQNEFDSKFHSASENTIITLQFDNNEEHDVLVKNYQEDPIRGFLTHIDFYAIEAGVLLTTNIPIHFEGTPAGVLEGGILEERLQQLEVECLPKDIPEYIALNVENLQIGDTVHVEDLEVPENVTVLSSPDQSVVTVTTMKEEIPEPGEEGEGEEVEPELVGEEGEEVEGEEGEEEASSEE